jgi:flagellar protein FlgJ
MTTPVADASVYSDMAGLAALKRDARAQDPTALRAVAKQFESIFAKMMLSSMRKASFGDPLLGSDQQDFYQGMFDDQLSVELTKGKGLGLADLLVQQLTRAGLAPADGTKDANGVGGAKSGHSADASMATADGSMATANASQGTALFDGSKGTALLAPSGSAHGVAATKTGATSTAANLAASIASSLDFRTAAARGSLFGFEGSALFDSGIADAGGTGSLDGSSPLDSTNALIAKMMAAHRASADTKTTFEPRSPEEFVRELWPCAEAAGKELGVDPRHLLAQAALETGWGKYLPCDTQGNTSFNLFGIKATGDWNGNSVSVRTLEFEGGVPVPRQARFRAYDSAADSFRDYVSVLRDNPRYAAALNTGSDTKAFTTALQRGGYATDPAYARKISAIAQNLPVPDAALKSIDAAPIPSPLALF